MITFQVPYMPSADQPEPQRDRTPSLVAIFKKVLTSATQRQAKMIYDKYPSHERNAVFLEKIITPVMPKIDKMTGQKNDPKYFAYALEHVLNSRGLDV